MFTGNKMSMFVSEKVRDTAQEGTYSNPANGIVT